MRIMAISFDAIQMNEISLFISKECFVEVAGLLVLQSRFAETLFVLEQQLFDFPLVLEEVAEQTFELCLARSSILTSPIQALI